jgi:hypothetical protein
MHLSTRPTKKASNSKSGFRHASRPRNPLRRIAYSLHDASEPNGVSNFEKSQSCCMSHVNISRLALHPQLTVGCDEKKALLSRGSPIWVKLRSYKLS